MTKKVYVIEQLPIGMELSDVDRAALYGGLGAYLEDSENDERKE